MSAKKNIIDAMCIYYVCIYSIITVFFCLMNLRRSTRPATAYASVVNFLQRTYWSIAETLPHELDIQPDEYGKTQDTLSYRQQLMTLSFGLKLVNYLFFIHSCIY